MIAIENYMNIFLNVLNDTFRERVWFVGLRGLSQQKASLMTCFLFIQADVLAYHHG